jgi:hypothetical protein
MELIETKAGNQGQIYSSAKRLGTPRVYYLKKIAILKLKMFAQLKNFRKNTSSWFKSKPFTTGIPRSKSSIGCAILLNSDAFRGRCPTETEWYAICKLLVWNTPEGSEAVKQTVTGPTLRELVGTVKSASRVALK